MGQKSKQADHETIHALGRAHAQAKDAFVEEMTEVTSVIAPMPIDIVCSILSTEGATSARKCCAEIAGKHMAGSVANRDKYAPAS